MRTEEIDMAGRIGPALAPARRVLVMLLAFGLAIAWSEPFAKADEPPVETWLRGSGADLEMRLHGEVVDANGKPAQGVEITGAMRSDTTTASLAAKPEANHFEIWLPVNRSKWHALWIKAIDSTTGHIAYHTLSPRQFREAALTGLTLTLAEPTRQIAVTPLFQDKPAPHAMVQLELNYGIKMRAEADNAGVAHFSLLPTQKLSSVTAWKDHKLIGGFSFDRKPTRDPTLNEHAVELHPARQEVIRIIDEQGAPVPGIPFTFYVGTPAPFFNFIGVNEEFELTTEDDGAATCRLFPDWKESHSYLEIRSDKWYIDGESKLVDGAMVSQVLPYGSRQPVRGRVVSAETNGAGFCVEMSSSQNPRANYPDSLLAFADANGDYEVRVWPDATYCASVIDDRWVGKPVDLIPFQTTPPVAAAPELTVVAGQAVDVLLTVGDDNQPIPNQPVHFSLAHVYHWRENGEQRNGTGGPRWWATTDDHGRIATRSYPGTLTVSVYTTLWRDEQKVTVVAGEPATVHIHHDTIEKHRLTGSIVSHDGSPLDSGVELRAQAIDGKSEDQPIVHCDSDGSFAFEVQGEKIGLLAKTIDGNLVAAAIVDDFTAPVQLTLKPTTTFEGQLLRKLDKPLPDHPVNAYVRLEGHPNKNGVLTIMDGIQIKTNADAEGCYTLRGVPYGVKLVIFAENLDGSPSGYFVDDVLLTPDEVRPRLVTRMARSDSDYSGALADRYKTLLRDCRLSGYRLLVIDADQANHVTSFIDRAMLDDDENPDINRYMLFSIPRAAKELTDADRAFIAKMKWAPPAAAQVIAYAIDPSGQELARIDVNVKQQSSTAAVKKFIAMHAPPRHDAEQIWADALAEAERTNRRVWARVSGRHCGPCFQLSRWLDDHRELLEQDFVLIKIDGSNDLNAAQISLFITGGKEGGIPFHAIFAPAGERLIDSEGPAGNIGNPSGDEGKRHLRRMLTETRQRLTDAEIDQLIDSLE